MFTWVNEKFFKKAEEVPWAIESWGMEAYNRYAQAQAKPLQVDWSRMDIIGQNGNDGLHYDAVEHPKHYTSHPSGIECIQITEHMGFNLGNALKYVWRCDLKKDAIEDLKKAIWYIERELAKRTKGE